MLYVLVLLYVFNGQLVLEKPAFETAEKCQTAGIVRVEELQKHPSFDGGLYAQCVPLSGSKG